MQGLDFLLWKLVLVQFKIIFFYKFIKSTIKTYCEKSSVKYASGLRWCCWIGGGSLEIKDGDQTEFARYSFSKEFELGCSAKF